jgi:predicted transcriptional regulator
MSEVKAEAIRLIESLHEHCSLEDIQYHLYIVQKVQKGQTDVDEGRVVPHEEAERRVAEWGKSSGRNPRSTT